MAPIDILAHRAAFAVPRRLTTVPSWHHHIPFAFFVMQLLRPRLFVELGTHRGSFEGTPIRTTTTFETVPGPATQAENNNDSAAPSSPAAALLGGLMRRRQSAREDEEGGHGAGAVEPSSRERGAGYCALAP